MIFHSVIAPIILPAVVAGAIILFARGNIAAARLASLGAVEISRDRYMNLLLGARARDPAMSLPAAWDAVRQASSGSAAGAASSSPGKLIAQSFTQTS